MFRCVTTSFRRTSPYSLEWYKTYKTSEVWLQKHFLCIKIVNAIQRILFLKFYLHSNGISLIMNEKKIKLLKTSSAPLYWKHLEKQGTLESIWLNDRFFSAKLKLIFPFSGEFTNKISYFIRYSFYVSRRHVDAFF